MQLNSTIEALERGRRDGTHIGWQLYVSHHRAVVADACAGVSRPGSAMTTGTLMIWLSATKAITAVAAAQQWERGRFALDDPVAAYIPEFATHGKGAVTIRHLFTHTAGIRRADVPERTALIVPHGYSPFVSPWRERLSRIIGAQLEPGWIPGRRAGYHPFSTMFLLAEIVARLDGRPFHQYVRREIFEPLGMPDCWIGMPADEYQRYGDRIGVLYITRPGRDAMPFPRVNTEEGCTACAPGSGGRGPMNQLGRFYEALLGGGSRDGSRILTPQTVEAMVARHRTGLKDESFGVVIDWGLGFIVDAFTYGRHSSPRAFGHGGGQSSVAFADPEYGLVVALVMNGLPGPAAHYRRIDEVTTLIYEDLGIAAAGDPGRARPVPAAGYQ